MNALLLSDIDGSHGADLSYMADWARLLALHGHDAQPLYLDSLCPEAHADKPFSRDAVHSRFVAGATGTARGRLCQMLAARDFDLLAGMSLGGYLACLCRPVLAPSAAMVCISSTRLRLHAQLPGRAAVHALFGASDPHCPPPGLRFDDAYHAHLLPDAGHDLYRSADRCAFVLHALGLVSCHA